MTGALIFEGLKALLSGIVCKAFLLKVKGKKKKQTTFVVVCCFTLKAIDKSLDVRVTRLLVLDVFILNGI